MAARLPFLLLAIVSTFLVGRKTWCGWIVAGVKNLLICIIGARTDQFGFSPANMFRIALYSYSLWAWSKRPQQIAGRFRLRAKRRILTCKQGRPQFIR